MTKTKVFTSGNSQAVRLPKNFQVQEKELRIQKIGTSIVLNPISSPWASLKKSLERFSDDAFSERREQPKLQSRESF